LCILCGEGAGHGDIVVRQRVNQPKRCREQAGRKNPIKRAKKKRRKQFCTHNKSMALAGVPRGKRKRRFYFLYAHTRRLIFFKLFSYRLRYTTMIMTHCTRAIRYSIIIIIIIIMNVDGRTRIGFRMRFFLVVNNCTTVINYIKELRSVYTLHHCVFYHFCVLAVQLCHRRDDVYRRKYIYMLLFRWSFRPIHVTADYIWCAVDLAAISRNTIF